jgi:hypothetical protein
MNWDILLKGRQIDLPQVSFLLLLWKLKSWLTTYIYYLHDCVSTCYHMIVSPHVITWLSLHMLSHDCVFTCYHMIVSPHVITWLCLHMLSHDCVSTCYHMSVSTCYHMIVSSHVITWLCLHMLSHDCVSTCYHMIVSPHVISKYKWLAVNNWNFQSSNFVREC